MSDTPVLWNLTFQLLKKMNGAIHQFTWAKSVEEEKMSIYSELFETIHWLQFQMLKDSATAVNRSLTQTASTVGSLGN